MKIKSEWIQITLLSFVLVFILGSSEIFAANLNITINSVPSGPIPGGGVTCKAAGITQPCSPVYINGTNLQLIANPSPGFLFTGWSGSCSGTSQTCSLTMSTNRSVTAKFEKPLLTITKTGTGTGRIKSPNLGVNLGGIDCGSSCTGRIAAGTQILLVAEPGTGFFDGWVGPGCSGTGDCTVTMNSNKTITAPFYRPILTVQKQGDGASASTVTSITGGINCGNDCTEEYNYGSSVALSGNPGNNFIYAGLSGVGCGPANCSMFTHRTAIATFRRPELSVSIQGSGQGTVTSTPNGINCSSGTCVEDFAKNTGVDLTATPANSSAFAGFTGNCSPSQQTPTCYTVTDKDKSVGARFVRAYTLNVTINGTGSVTGSNINCPGNCSATFSELNDTNVTLTATIPVGTQFNGWSGDCTGTQLTCIVSMRQSRNVTASFVNTR